MSKLIPSNTKKDDCVQTPKEFPQSGFQMGCFYLQKYHEGNITLSNMEAN